MKTKFLLLLLLPVFCFSQSGEKECADNAKQVEELVKSEKYDMAYLLWEASSICASESLYLSGEKIIQHLLAAPTTESEKKTYVTALLKLYEADDKNFPRNKRANLLKRAKTLKAYEAGTPEEIFALYDRAFKTDLANFNDPKALYDYFELYFNKFTAGEKGIAEEDVLTKQDDLLIKLNQLLDTADSKRDYQTAYDGIKAIAASANTCEKWYAHYEKNLPTKKENAEWLRVAADNLISQNCSVGTLLGDIATAWHTLKPDAKSAYTMGIAALFSRQNQPEAAKYFDESLALEKDASKKADIYLVLSSLFTATDQPKAIDYVKKALELRPKHGKSYFLLAQLYAATGCGETAFEKKALYILASQTAAKAGVVDPTMKKAATAIAERYLKKGPTKDEIKEAKKAGKSVLFACGINQSVTIPQ